MSAQLRSWRRGLQFALKRSLPAGRNSIARARAGLDLGNQIGYLQDIQSWKSPMATRNTADQIAFRYRPTDSATGVSRDTAKRLAQRLGVDETQAIHLALHNMAVRLLPQYEADSGPLTAAQVRQIRQRIPQGKKRSVRTSLFDVKSA